MIKKLTSHVFLLMIAAYAECVAAELDLIHPNDNLKSAGIFDDGELHLNLIAEPGMWHPETEQNPGIEVRAFRERDKPLQTPGPMVRITEGTEVRVSIRNAIPDTVLEVHGFQSRPSNEESVLSIPAGETVTATFRAGKPGTISTGQRRARHFLDETASTANFRGRSSSTRMVSSQAIEYSY